jgi:hypothetical protein
MEKPKRNLRASDKYNRCLTKYETRPKITINPPRINETTETSLTLRNCWFILIYKTTILTKTKNQINRHALYNKHISCNVCKF